MTHAALFLAAVLLLCVTGGQAQTDTVPPAEALKNWGLLGKWKVDCAAPEDNGLGGSITYRIDPDGQPVSVNVVGTNNILAAHDNSNGTITIQMKYSRPVEGIRTLVIERTTEGIRAVMNRSERNVYSIKDGILLTTGEKMPTLRKCAN